MKRSAAGGPITRVRLRNYKSIAICSVDLAALTIMVGPNGAGKSNFLDGLGFTAEALQYSVDHALRERGGIDEVRRRDGECLGGFAVRIDLRLSDATGWYGFEICGTGRGCYVVRREQCVVKSEDPERCGNFRVYNGSTVTSSISTPPPSVGADRLYLLPASAYGPFRPVYDALSAMAFYHFDPVSIRDLQAPDSGDRLERSGTNVASVLDRLKTRSPATGERIDQYLAAIVPGAVGVEPISVGPRLTVEFRERAPGEAPRPFLANSMSDGTLHVLGVLVALFQRADGAGEERGLIGIEEPETALHPAAAGALSDVLREASEHVQVIVTRHSADLLDRDTIATGSILAVDAEHGETRIAAIDETGRTSCRDGLFTAGELLRMDQLTPAPESATPASIDLFATRNSSDPNRSDRRRRRRGESGSRAASADRRGSVAARGTGRSPADSRAARALSRCGRAGTLRQLGRESRRPGGRILVLLDANGDLPGGTRDYPPPARSRPAP